MAFKNAFLDATTPTATTRAIFPCVGVRNARVWVNFGQAPFRFKVPLPKGEENTLVSLGGALFPSALTQASTASTSTVPTTSPIGLSSSGPKDGPSHLFPVSLLEKAVSSDLSASTGLTVSIGANPITASSLQSVVLKKTQKPKEAPSPHFFSGVFDTSEANNANSNANASPINIAPISAFTDANASTSASTATVALGTNAQIGTTMMGVIGLMPTMATGPAEASVIAEKKDEKEKKEEPEKVSLVHAGRHSLLTPRRLSRRSYLRMSSNSRWI